MYELSESSRRVINHRLSHPEIKRLVEHAITNSPYYFEVVETVYNKNRHGYIPEIAEFRDRALIGFNKHIPKRTCSGMAEAFAFEPINGRHVDFTVCKDVARHIKNVAKKIGINVVWCWDKDGKERRINRFEIVL